MLRTLSWPAHMSPGRKLEGAHDLALQISLSLITCEVGFGLGGVPGQRRTQLSKTQDTIAVAEVPSGRGVG